ncbi:type II secretion system F family protein [Acetomicrobium hydrogeniformans]|uniref:Bacterial type II secretion system protein F domain protein n=1 Tax=Acetomicrobium hydrogeniformans ATCC BAA-1850 TaxID=592015 RepID=A0A0T5XA24_9BACT|nr:type II secretion system F family protein [Acetomicrobium hydrogeniformans]KRT35203.1 bacterial type II secretion system protein F domain protein [Acetomicrobium hydrogeniformans ATCC BAA-1850]
MAYRYRAKSKEGKIVQGTLEAYSEEQVLQWLRERAYYPIEIEEVREGAVKTLKERLQTFSTIRLKDKAVFFRQLATMLDAGITLGMALDMLAEQTENKRFAEAIREVKTMVDRGISLSAAMATKREFSKLMVAIARAGEEGGVLESSLDRLATFLERQDELRKKIISASTYPAVVMGFALMVVFILVTVIMPRFTSIFMDLDIRLPLPTRIILGFSMWMSHFWYLPVGLVLLLILVIYTMAKNKNTKAKLDAFRLKLPLFGDIWKKSVLARTFRTFAALVQAGVPILSALEMTADVSGNAVVEDAFAQMSDQAKRGMSMGETAKKIKVIPPLAAHMITVGEQTGRLEDMVDKVADWFEFELDEKIKRLTSIIEPVLIVFVGGVVALVVFAVFMPIIGSIQGLLAGA